MNQRLTKKKAKKKRTNHAGQLALFAINAVPVHAMVSIHSLVAVNDNMFDQTATRHLC
jgi:hypothetical protein